VKLLRRPGRAGLPQRLDALAAAVADGERWLPGDVIAEARRVVERAGERSRLSSAHTVVALAGSTGSGKSSIFNAATGLEIARVGVRRPTTSEPLACIWGTYGAGELLDWLGIPSRHRVPKESLLDSAEADALDGLVLLDLPDHDSAIRSHQMQVDRLVKRVDLFVWVVDPQKYADAALHEQYLRPMADHAAVTVVVLNQIDLLSQEDVKACVADLERILTEDGLPKIPIFPMSATTGEGMAQFTDLLRPTVAQRRASEDRVGADVSAAAEALTAAAGPGSPKGPVKESRERLIATLADAAGVDVVADAVGGSYRRRAYAATGWPFIKWLARLRRDPLRRLGLRRRSVSSGLALPRPSPVQRSRSDAAVRAFTDAAVGGGPKSWVAQVRAVSNSAANRLPNALDRAVGDVNVDIEHRPRWWQAIGFVQQVLTLATLVGLGWLAALAAGQWMQLPDIPTPEIGVLPVPTVMVLGAVVLGIIVSLLARLFSRTGARRRSALVRRKLHDAVTTTVSKEVIAPVTSEVERLEAFRKTVKIAKA
jgi:GTP-binding protein EngB required for normal cell division